MHFIVRSRSQPQVVWTHVGVSTMLVIFVVGWTNRIDAFGHGTAIGQVVGSCVIHILRMLA